MGQGKMVLVVMTNGDVYYISGFEASRLRHSQDNGQFDIKDLKSGKKVTLFIPHISSIVEEA